MDVGEMKRKGAATVAFYKGNGEQVDYFLVDELVAAITAAVAEERERCARIADEYNSGNAQHVIKHPVIAERIRRG